MAKHSYHPMCGCAQCCESELAMERDDDMGNQYRDELIACPSFIAELALENEEAESIAIAVRTNDLHVIGIALIDALYRAADDMIVTRADESGTTPGEAAKHLYEAYRDDDDIQKEKDMILVPREELIAWANAWLNVYGPKDGTHCPTPFDLYLVKAPYEP